MPSQVLPLRMLSTSASVSFSTMKLNTSVQFQSSHGVSLFSSRVFPLKLNYLALSKNGLCSEGNRLMGFSTNAFRGRNGGGSRNSEFSRGRGSFRGRGLGGRVREGKSLVEDEGELSDWIGEMKRDSFRGGVSSGSDDDSGRGSFRGSGRGRGGGRGRGRDSGLSKSQRVGRGAFAASERGMSSDSDDFDISDRRSSRGSMASSFSGRRDFDRDVELSPRRMENGTGSDFSSPSRRGGRDSDSTYGRSGGGGRDFGSSYGRSRGGGRDSGSSYGRSRGGGRDSGLSYGRSRGGGRDSGSSYGRSRGGGRDSGLGYGRSRGGGRGSDSSYAMSRGGGRDSDSSYGTSRGGGRDSELSYGRSRDGGSGSIERGKKRSPLISEEDDEDDESDSSFGNLLSGIDSDEDDDEDEDEEDEEEVSPKRRGEGLRGAVSSLSKNDGRSSYLNSGGSQDGGILQKTRQQLLRTSDDDTENDNSTSSFADFLSDEDTEEDTDSDVLNSVDSGSLRGSIQKDKARPTPKTSSGEVDSYLSGTRFDQCAVSPLTLKAIKDAGYENMTVVQEATLPAILKGKDVLAKARTGTGKTVAFLLPAIEAIVKSPPVDRDQKRPPINVLVMCPTRELASQAAAEATKLLKYHPSIGVQIVIGGVRLTSEQKRLQANPCQILVATPGRLKDHIENTPGFGTRLMGVKVLVLDEADHLLDMGFRKDIEKIISAVPKQRQTLLFSATVPPDVRQICLIALKRDHEFINTVEEGSEETHAQVSQTHLVAPLEKQFSLIYALLKDHIADDPEFKVLVFCTTAMVTKLVAELLSELKLNVREIHSRKPQGYRTRVSDEFRKSTGIILVTSDVSARGVDYPDVTLVIQVGLPSDREQYIHRLGRTGRKGKEGQGILLLAPWEESFLSSIKDLPITKASVPSVDPDTRKKVERALSNVEMKTKETAYQAWLGYYNSHKIVSRDKARVVELANEFSGCMGLDTPPAMSKLIIGKMGLKNVPGLRIK